MFKLFHKNEFTDSAPNVIPKLKPLTKWQRLWRRYKLHTIVVGLVLLLAGGVLAWYLAGDKEPATATETPTDTQAAPLTKPSLTNGVMVSPDIANRHPVAVMVENSPVARPQTGLDKADIVYEVVTEGGITRFMGIYSQEFPSKVGPVRSARSYFIDYLSEYDAFYAHAGGSPTALGRILDYKIKAYPHNNDSYHREPKAGVSSEHTLFVDVSKIFKFGVEKRGWPSTYETKSWLFKEDLAERKDQGPITINFSSPTYKVTWKYDKTKNLYLRELAGTPHKDALSGEQLSAKTIITMNVFHGANPPYSSGKESEWGMATIGQAAMSVFQDGQRINGQWKKPDRKERTRFYNESQQEVQLNRGKIWIEVIPQEGSVSVAEAVAN